MLAGSEGKGDPAARLWMAIDAARDAIATFLTVVGFPLVMIDLKLVSGAVVGSDRTEGPLQVWELQICTTELGTVEGQRC